MASTFRYSSLIAAFLFGLYVAIVFATLSFHQWQILSQIRAAHGSVEYQTVSLFHWMPGDRVQSITLPESAISNAPSLLTEFRCFRQLKRVAIEVMTPECSDKLHLICAPNGGSALEQYYRFLHAGRPCSRNSTAPIPDEWIHLLSLNF